MKNAYHFTANTLRDGRAIPPVGEWLEYDGEIEICKSGLHFSKDPFDALQYAPGNLLHLVEVDEIEHEHDDKGVCRRRRIIATIDAESLLREFARWCVLQLLDLWDAPTVVREYLETGDETKRDAAWSAAWSDAWAKAAARSAAKAAAWDAAWEAARGAAWEAARSAAREAQRTEFRRRVEAAFEGTI